MNQPNVSPAAQLAATGKDPVFDNGNDAARRMTDPVVAIVVTVNLSIKNGQRTMSCSAPLHEVPLLRRLYTALGGTVTPRTDWVPGLRRRAKLTHAQLQDELRRLSEKYQIPTEGGKRDIMAEIYGATGAERLRSLRNKMAEAHRGWGELETAAMVKIRAAGKTYHRLEVESLISELLSEKDVDRLVRSLDPAEATADEIELTALDAAEQTLAPQGEHVLTGDDAPAGGPRMSLADVFGKDDEPTDQPPSPVEDADLQPAELTEADVLIANLRSDGLDSSLANQVALIVTAIDPGAERKDKLAEIVKGKALAIVTKRLREFDSVVAPAKT